MRKCGERGSLVGKAVANDGCALQYASPDFRADRYVVLAAVANKARERRRVQALQAAADTRHQVVNVAAQLRADRGVVMKTVANDGRALRHASLEPRSDREVAMTAVEKVKKTL